MKRKIFSIFICMILCLMVTLPANAAGPKANVELMDFRMSMDSAGFVSTELCFRNNSNKTVKYIDFEVAAYNRVGDRIPDVFTGKSTNNTQHDTTKKRSHKSGSSCYFRGMRGYISISKSSGFRRLPGTAIFL